MIYRKYAALAALVAIAAAGGDVLAKGGKKDDIKPTVAFAPSWDAAVAEAKHLNVPMVVHSHGFY